MNLIKTASFVIGAAALLTAFQNCGQPGSLSQASTDQVAKLTDTSEEVVTPVVDPTLDDSENNLCEEDVAGLLVKEVKAPGDSKFSAHLFTSDPNLSVKLGANKILVTAKGDAIKIDKIDLILSEKNRGRNIRIILDRNDYTVKKDGKYVLQFSLSVAEPEKDNAGHSCGCRILITEASLVAQ